MNKTQTIEKAAEKFLCWKLPENFSPDCGISFKSESDFNHPEFGRHKFEPVGTNLFNFEQAKAMMAFCLDELLDSK